MNALPWSGGVVPGPDPDPNPNPTPSGIIKFTDNQKWGKAYAYFWNDSSTDLGGKWPGIQMNSAGKNEYGENLFSVNIPEGATYVVFTNGTDQTVDTVLTGAEGYYTDGTKDDQGHFNTLPW